MDKKIVSNCVVTIENDETKKTLWLEEITLSNGKKKYETVKRIEYKNPEEQARLTPDEEAH